MTDTLAERIREIKEREAKATRGARNMTNERIEQIKQIRAYGLQAEPTALLLAIDDLLSALPSGEPQQPRCPKCGSIFLSDFYTPTEQEFNVSINCQSCGFRHLANNLADLDQFSSAPSPLPTYEQSKPHMGYAWPGFNFDGDEERIKYVFNRMRDAMQKYLGVAKPSAPSPQAACPKCGSAVSEPYKSTETGLWTQRCNKCEWFDSWAGVAPSGSAGQEPQIINPPFQKALTIIMLRDESDKQAEKDLQTIADNKSTVVRIGVPELYFHHLRLRVAQDPLLADKIAVFYVTPSDEMQEVELKSGQQIRWPVGFGDQIWNKEKEVQQAKMREVGLKFDNELKWPAGFCQEHLSKEIAIRSARKNREPEGRAESAAERPEICPTCGTPRKYFENEPAEPAVVSASPEPKIICQTYNLSAELRKIAKEIGQYSEDLSMELEFAAEAAETLKELAAAQPVAANPSNNWQDLYQRTEYALLALRIELGGKDFKTNALDHITSIRYLLKTAKVNNGRFCEHGVCCESCRIGTSGLANPPKVEEVANKIGGLASYWMHPKSEALAKFKKDVAEILGPFFTQVSQPPTEEVKREGCHKHPTAIHYDQHGLMRCTQCEAALRLGRAGKMVNAFRQQCSRKIHNQREHIKRLESKLKSTPNGVALAGAASHNQFTRPPSEADGPQEEK